MAEEKKIVKAKQSFIRQTARKVRRTVNLIRDLSAGEAVAKLEFMPYAAAVPVKKLLESAIANASNNFDIENAADLRISEILVDDGPIFKRWRAASKGRAVSVYKRTAKISVVLSEMKPAEYAAYVKANSPKNNSRAKAVEVEG